MTPWCCCRITYDAATVRQRLEELAYLNASAVITFRVQPPAAKGGKGALPPATEETLHYKGGLKEFVIALNKGRREMHKPIMLSREVRSVLGFRSACKAFRVPKGAGQKILHKSAAEHWRQNSLVCCHFCAWNAAQMLHDTACSQECLLALMQGQGQAHEPRGILRTAL